jgi:hypothetical protein
MSGFESKRQASKDLLEPQAQPAANEWREAIDAELVCLHLGTADSFPDAGAALAALIDWHVQVALDPEVSSSAQALVDRGAAQPQAEPVVPGFTEGHCAEKAKKGGCQLHNLHCGYPACDRRPTSLPAQAVAEPLTDDELRECFTSTNTAEPLSEGWPGLERFARAIEARAALKASK